MSKWSASVAIAALAGSTALGQNTVPGAAVVVGQVKSGESGLPIPYSVIAIPSLGRQQFSTSEGGFTIWNLPAGSLKLRVKRIGYSPRDTNIVLRENDTLRLQVVLSRLAFQLPEIRVSAACGSDRGDERTNGILAELFDQVRQNAERYRLLADSNPFSLTLYHARGFRVKDGRIAATEVDTVIRGPFPASGYVARHLIKIEVDSGTGDKHYYLATPELADFADTGFSANHCFTYEGRRVVDDDSALAVSFEPIPDLKGEVDFRGTFFVRSFDYQLIRAELEVTRVPRELWGTGMQGMTITSRFSEILPGIAILQEVESTTRYSGRQPPHGEVGLVVGMKWAKGPP